MSSRSEVTRILTSLARGEAPVGADEKLMDLVYVELRRMAAGFLRREREGHTLQPTALVNEVYLKLVDPGQSTWADRAHFMRVAARAMRQILIDHARRKRAARRGGDWQRVTFDEAVGLAVNDADELIALNDALEAFAELDPRAAKVVELRVFGGMTVKEAAEVLEVSPRTVDGDWAMALAWLGRELSGDDATS